MKKILYFTIGFLVLIFFLTFFTRGVLAMGVPADNICILVPEICFNNLPAIPTGSVSATNIQTPGIRFTATDPDGNNLTYTYSIDNTTYNLAGGSAASGAYTAYTTAHGTLSWGLHTAYIKVDDGNGGSNSGSFTFTLTLPTYSLTVTKAGTGLGTVTSSPAGVSCGSDCSQFYNSGTVVALPATPAAGSSFAGWSGACTGTGSCNVTMSAAKSVTATFNIILIASGLKFTPSVTRSGVAVTGVTILPDPVTNPTVTIFTVCTDPNQCTKPVRAGDNAVVNFYIVDQNGNLFTGGTYSSVCKLIDPDTNAETTCGSSIATTGAGTINQTATLNLINAGIIRLTITGNTYSKTINIRIPRIQTLE